MYYYDRAFILKQEEEHSTGKQERLQFPLNAHIPVGIWNYLKGRVALKYRNLWRDALCLSLCSFL